MRLCRLTPEESGFRPPFLLLSDSVISALFPGICGHLLLAIVPNLSPNGLGTIGRSPWPQS